MTSGSIPPTREHSARFAEVIPPVLPDNFEETSSMDVEFKRLLVACSPIRQHKATSIISIGPLHSGDQDIRETLSALQPHLSIKKLMSRSKESFLVTVLSFNIPFIQIDIFKHVLDSLQFWADDVSQLIERTFISDSDNAQQNMDELIARTQQTTASKGVRARSTIETVVKIAISDGMVSIQRFFVADKKSTAFARAMIPELQDTCIMHPFIISAFDICAVVESNPKGKANVFSLPFVIFAVAFLRMKLYSPLRSWI
jgi:autophagy-related protein 2